MMVNIPLVSIANQSFSMVLSQHTYDVILKSLFSTTVFSLAIDGVQVLSSQRIVAGYPMIPYKYIEEGNFVILTANEELPYYLQFGISQFLVFADQEELDAIRAAA